MIKNILLIMTAILFLSCSNVKEEAEPEPIQEPEPPAVVEKNRLCAIRDEREADFTFSLEHQDIASPSSSTIFLLDKHEKVIQAVKDQKASAYVMIDCTDPNNPIIASYSLDPSRSQNITQTPNRFQVYIDAKKEMFPQLVDPQMIADYFPLVDEVTADKFFPYDKNGGAYSFEGDFEGDDTDLETYIAIWKDIDGGMGFKREAFGFEQNDGSAVIPPVKQEDVILLVVEGYEEITDEPDNILGDIIYWGSLVDIFNYKEYTW